jgi:fucose 4-O-acetylase-like acetyltransferase
VKDNAEIFTEQRIDWIDALKFLGIFAIYLGHFGTFAGKLYSFVFQYHVPLFFFISGFFATKVHKETAAQFIKKKFLNLMLPYFLFAFLSEIVNALINNLNANQVLNDFTKYIWGVRNTLPAAQLCFFPCLFLVVVIYYLLLLAVKNKYIILALTTVMSVFINVTPSWFWNLDSAFRYLFFYSLGAVIFPLLKTFNFHKLGTIRKLLYVSLILLSGLFASMCYFKGSYYLFHGFPLPFYLCNLHSDFVACILIFLNIQVALAFRRINLFLRIGQETLILCGLEQIVKPLLVSTLKLINLKLTLENPFETVLYTAVCIGVAFLLSKPVKKMFSSILDRKQKTVQQCPQQAV